MSAASYWLSRRRRPMGQTTVTKLGDIADAINTAGKYKNKVVTAFGSGSAITEYVAQGPAASDAWRPTGVFTSADDITPA